MTATGAYVGNETYLLDAYTKWMGSAPDDVLVPLNQYSWSAFDSSVPYFAGKWQSSSSHPIYGVPLTVNGTSLEDVASGSYNSHFLAAAKTLAAADRHDGKPIYIRLGWEFNGDWQPWAAKGHEAAFIKSFQQVVDTFRSVSSNFKFVWDVNIGGNNMDPAAAYPGDKYVDVVGTDVYWSTKWDTTDPNKAFADKVSGGYEGHGLQWQQDFAAAHGKPTAISEWGVMSDNASPYLNKMASWMKDHNMVYENYWDSNADFLGLMHENQYPTAGVTFRDVFDNLGGSSSTPVTSSPIPSKPATTTPVKTPSSGTGGSTPPVPTTTTPAATSGADTLVVRVSADSFAGDPHFLVTVDGKQVGGVQTTGASHDAGKTQNITLKGSFGSGAHDVAVQFIDDRWGGTDSTDRNLYVHQVSLNGKVVAGPSASSKTGHIDVDGGAAALLGNGTISFHVSPSSTATSPAQPVTPPPVLTKPSAGTVSSDTGAGNALVLDVSADSFGGDPKFVVKVDGKQVGGVQTAHASHSSGKSDQVTLHGNFSNADHISVQFLNDLWGGTASTDRNLYVDRVALDGHSYVTASSDVSAPLLGNGTVDFHRAA